MAEVPKAGQEAKLCVCKASSKAIPIGRINGQDQYHPEAYRHQSLRLQLRPPGSAFCPGPQGIRIDVNFGSTMDPTNPGILRN
jgi:hypothetical protein